MFDSVTINKGDLLVFYPLEKETTEFGVRVFSPAVLKTTNGDNTCLPMPALKIVSGKPVEHFIRMVESSTGLICEEYKKNDIIEPNLRLLAGDSFKENAQVFLCVEK